MTRHWKSRLAPIPLLLSTCLGWAADPVLIHGPDVDDIAADPKPALDPVAMEQFAGVLAKLNHPGDLRLTELSLLPPDQLAQIMAMAAGELAFRQLIPGELMATRQFSSGAQLVLVKQLGAAGSLFQLSQDDAITTRALQPGDTLKIQQSSSNGINYLLIRSSGSATVTILPRKF